MQTAVSNTIMGVSIVFFVLVSLRFSHLLISILFQCWKEKIDEKEDSRTGKARSTCRGTSRKRTR